MVVTAIITSAVLALSNAVASAYECAQDNARRNAGVRSANVFFNDAVRNCNLILKIGDNRICFWINDNNLDSVINPCELVYFDYVSSTNTLNMVRFSGVKEISDILSFANFNSSNYMDFLIFKYNERKITLIENCVALKFSSDHTAPYAKLVNLSFDIEENGKKHHFEFTANKQTVPSAWLDSTGILKSAGDDD